MNIWNRNGGLHVVANVKEKISPFGQDFMFDESILDCAMVIRFSGTGNMTF